MIKQDTEQLSLEKGRRPGQPGHEIALKFLESRMSEIGLAPYESDNYALPYGVFTNLAGIIKGTDSSALPVLIGAHYDSAIDSQCSDDNAVSVALILHTAELLTRNPPSRKTIIAFFDAEEKPTFLTENMGSVRFYEDHCREAEFACVIILDMIGHNFEVGVPPVDLLVPGIKDFMFVLGSESHGLLPEIVEEASANTKKLRVIPTLNRYIGDRSDHHAFKEAGQPYLFLSRGWGKHSHTPEDNISWINFKGVQRVESFLIRLLEQLDTASMETSRHPADPFRYEIRMMRKAIGWPLPVILACLGFFKLALHSRKDIDSLMGKVLKLAKV
jgi:Zn-dependent M28 family amino/carboxypeptidase